MQTELPSSIEQKQAVAVATVTALNKTYGKGTLQKINPAAKAEKMPSYSTGLPTLDTYVLGIGGVPKGRIVEIYGPESCLDRDTFIQYTVWENGSRVNHKGGSIKNLYDRFHNTNDVHGAAKTAVTFTAPSVNEENKIFHNKIVDVVKTGTKNCFLVSTEDGHSIVATGEHKFLTDGKYVPCSSLVVGDYVSIHNKTPYKTTSKKYSSYKEIFVKYHPVAPTKIVEKKYLYHRLPVHRAIVEAEMNNLFLSEYIDALNNYTTGLKYLTSDQHIHHIDEDRSNNNISNLAIMSASEHGKLHAIERHNNLRYIAIDSKITFIEEVGQRETYDIRMESPFNNYVANGFVVHNSGKTTVTLQIIGMEQKRGGLCAFIDAEHALDPKWAEKNGVDTSELLINQPDSGEQALDITLALVTSGAFSIIVVDSVAALVPQAELDGEMGDSHMGLQARLMSQACRKLTSAVARTGTCLIFINQIRDKIGVMFGSPETTTGGKALKFYAGVRLDIRKIGLIKDGDKIIGNKVKIKAVKNKVAPPFREAEFDLIYDSGFDTFEDLIIRSIDMQLVEKSGAWYVYEGVKVQGKPALKEFLREHPEALLRLTSEFEKAIDAS